MPRGGRNRGPGAAARVREVERAKLPADLLQMLDLDEGGGGDVAGPAATGGVPSTAMLGLPPDPLLESGRLHVAAKAKEMQRLTAAFVGGELVRRGAAPLEINSLAMQVEAARAIAVARGPLASPAYAVRHCCGKRFHSEDAYDTHVGAHETCKWCTFVGTGKLLKEHMIRTHQQYRPNPGYTALQVVSTYQAREEHQLQATATEFTPVAVGQAPQPSAAAAAGAAAEQVRVERRAKLDALGIREPDSHQIFVESSQAAGPTMVGHARPEPSGGPDGGPAVATAAEPSSGECYDFVHKGACARAEHCSFRHDAAAQQPARGPSGGQWMGARKAVDALLASSEQLRATSVCWIDECGLLSGFTGPAEPAPHLFVRRAPRYGGKQVLAAEERDDGQDDFAQGEEAHRVAKQQQRAFCACRARACRATQEGIAVLLEAPDASFASLLLAEGGPGRAYRPDELWIPNWDP